jgi:hypothetical protein
VEGFKSRPEHEQGFFILCRPENPPELLAAFFPCRVQYFFKTRVDQMHFPALPD